MARRKHRDEPELPLFDLPLRPVDESAGTDAPAAEAPVAEPPSGPSGEPPSGPSGEPSSGEPPSRAPGPEIGEEAEAGRSEQPAPEPPRPASQEPPGTAQLTLVTTAEPDAEATEDDEADADADAPVPLVDRLRSGLADLAVQLLMLAVAVAASLRLGVELTAVDWPPFVLLGLVFSFFYWVVPLAFWGQTPGMVWVGHVARADDEEPLTVGQAILRWVGAVLTAALAGLPLLLALLGGRSLSDRVSESRTRVARDP